MLILGIETSCDETAIAILEHSKEKTKVLSNVISSQIKLHAKFGGVVPALAAREHTKNLSPVLETALIEAKKKITDMDGIALTSGPGLIPALLVGTAFAKTIAWKYDLPLIPTNHMEGHMYSNWLGSNDIKLTDKSMFPSLCLIVSGGHTQLVLISGHGKYKLLGQTLDDAAGEAFDKIARLVELPYPGGPAISKEADKKTKSKIDIKLPRPMQHTKDFNFSFSGLKTAVLYAVKDLKKKHKMAEIRLAIAREAQDAIVEVLIHKTRKAAREFGVKSLMLAGGVSANKQLREHLGVLGNQMNLSVYLPDMEYTTDNAAMIAMAAIANLNGKKPSKKKYPWEKVQADANWEIV